MNDTMHTPHPTAPSASASDGTEPTVVFYWRPGCGFCRSLSHGLQEAGVEFQPVNIWEDRDAAAFVRSVASGNEVVPTIRVGSTALVNPSPRQVLRALEAERTTQAQPIP